MSVSTFKVTAGVYLVLVAVFDGPFRFVSGARKCLFRESSLVAMNAFFIDTQDPLCDLPAAAALHRSRRGGNLRLCERSYLFSHHAMRLSLTASRTFGGNLHASECRHTLCLPRKSSGLQG
jgi:hypothetical protein